MRFRAGLILCSLIVLIVSVVLILDFTASNPTGRRYSSETIDLALDFREKGLQGERILSHD